MRLVRVLPLLVVLAGCQQTPDQKYAEQVRSDAQQRGAAIENQAEAEAGRLDRQASDLKEQAKQSGGLTGERLSVRADALTKEAKIVRKQADMRAEAVKEAADAQIKTSQSR